MGMRGLDTVSLVTLIAMILVVLKERNIHVFHRFITIEKS